MVLKPFPLQVMISTGPLVANLIKSVLEITHNSLHRAYIVSVPICVSVKGNVYSFALSSPLKHQWILWLAVKMDLESLEGNPHSHSPLQGSLLHNTLFLGPSMLRSMSPFEIQRLEKTQSLVIHCCRIFILRYFLYMAWSGNIIPISTSSSRVLLVVKDSSTLPRGP